MLNVGIDLSNKNWRVIKVNKEDYSKYYIQGSDHYLIPKDEFVCLLKEIKELQSQLSYLRSGEYYNQLKFERDMLQHIVDNNEVSKEDKEFIDMTHRNTELLEENQQLKETIIKAIELIKKYVELQLKEDYLMNRANLMNYSCNLLNILESSDNK